MMETTENKAVREALGKCVDYVEKALKERGIETCHTSYLDGTQQQVHVDVNLPDLKNDALMEDAYKSLVDKVLADNPGLVQIVSAPLQLPKSVMGAEMAKGINLIMRAVYDYWIATDEVVVRFDLLYMPIAQLDPYSGEVVAQEQDRPTGLVATRTEEFADVPVERRGFHD
jgi:hypothetical protein